MNETFESLLRRVSLGELSADAPEVRAAARDDAEFSRELEAALALLSRLDRGSAEQAEILRRAEELEHSPGEERVATLVQARVAAAAARGRRRFLVVAGAAAAVLALVLVGPRFLGRDKDVKLGPGGLRCIVPAGPDSDFELFRWEADVDGGWFEVTVMDASTGAELATGRSGPIRSALEWRPPEADRRDWPDAIIWRVQWVDDDGVKRPSDWVEASR